MVPPPPFDLAEGDEKEMTVRQAEEYKKYMLPFFMAAVEPLMNTFEDKVQNAITNAMNGIRGSIDANAERLDRQNERITELEKVVAVMRAQAVSIAIGISAAGGFFTFFATYFVFKK